jgi:AraC-like DNA-binding protein
MGEYASITGLILSIIIFYFGWKHQPHNILFAAFQFTFSLVFYIEFQFQLGKNPSAVAVATMLYPWVQFLTGPLSYLYLATSTIERRYVNRSDAWHLIPVCIPFFSSIPHLLSPWNTKLVSAEVIIRQGNILEMNAFFSNAQILWLKIFHNVAYLVAGLILLFNYFRRLKREDGLDFGDITQRWILFFAGNGTSVAVINSILLFQRIEAESRHEFQVNSFLLIMTLLGIFICYNILLLFFPHILYGMLRLKTPDMIAAEMLSTPDSEEKKQKPNELKIFTEDYILDIKQRIQSYIDMKQYCEKDCSIGHLTSFSGIPAHHLSHYFNQILKERFPDWRNRLRIKYSISLMQEGNARSLKLDEIARQCGYNVRSTFIDAFRKEIGKTPGEFLKDISLNHQ